MNKKPITVYWSPFYLNLEAYTNLVYLHQLPKTLFNELNKNKLQTDPVQNANFLTCPAIANKFKKIFVFRNATDSKYFYDYSVFPPVFETKKDHSLFIERARPNHISNGPIFTFGMSNIFFADEPLDAYFTPPMFHKPKYINSGSIMPGEFDIGQWFRPYNFEMQAWDNKGEITFEDQEPLFYVEFKTDRQIILKRFELTQTLMD